MGLDLEKELQEIIESPLAPCAADTSHITVHYSSRVSKFIQTMSRKPTCIKKICGSMVRGVIVTGYLHGASPLNDH